jgi:hypothetical protein
VEATQPRANLPGRRVMKVLTLGLAALLTACVTPPTGTTYESLKRPVKPNMAQVVIYREMHPTHRYHPLVTLDGLMLGGSVPGTFFLVDRQPGKREILTHGDARLRQWFELAPGERKYIRLDLEWGHWGERIVRPLVVNPQIAQKEVRGLVWANPD